MRLLLILTFGLFCFNSSWAYYSLMDTAELVDEGKYNANVETQFITDGEDGLNLLGRFDSRLSDETSYRIEAGFGVVDFNIAAFYKWAPIPDTDKQPAISVAGGISIARYEFGKESANDLSLRVHPIISKKFKNDFGIITPYGGIPLGLRSVDGDTDLVAHLTFGSSVKPSRFDNISFMAELGFDLAEAFTYLSLGLNLSIDPDEGIKFQ
ncbi:MAG: hypothetical protein KDD58_11210 [Bdellovibrionales bacterium]|nr:hypothetical protein [Bdellovibrionales bacterium]